ncbi:MAG: hypothetical protein R3E83_25390 [Burkholderiaceae bacterium]
MPAELAARAVAAYGGASFWRSATRIEAQISAGGLAFRLKRRPFFTHARLEMLVHRPYCRLTPIGCHGEITGVLDGLDVRLERPDGGVLAERRNARSAFGAGRRLIRWDDLDMAYFANYAFWNYFTLPALLMNPSVSWRPLGDDCLQGRFPNSMPTHSEEQVFRFDPDTGLLRQHEYVARIISRFARAANRVLEHAQGEGPRYPSRRIVTPLGPAARALPGPVLIDIRVHRCRVFVEPESRSGRTP